MIFISFSSQADIFQWKDVNGNTIYSDKPHQGAKKLQIKAGSTFYKVKKIYDGDTIQLSNGKKIRLLGINTPEVESRYRAAQVGGKVAKQWLTEKLKKRKIRIEKDIEKKDKYGRLLVHVFTENGEHINLELVKKGLASVNIYPPNLKYIDDLLLAQDLAEKERLGIWSYADYLPKPATEVEMAGLKNWQRIEGRVKSIQHARKYSYIELSKVFSLKVAKKSLKFFPQLESYIGKKIGARGWIKRYKGRYRMFVRHPSALKMKI